MLLRYDQNFSVTHRPIIIRSASLQKFMVCVLKQAYICFTSSGAMTQVRKRYRQLRFEIDQLEDHYHMVCLRFKINRQEVSGLLNGSITDWMFESKSDAFLKIVPSGRLCKYALWCDGVPKQINKIYKGVWEAAMKAGYDLLEKEEASESNTAVDW